MRPPTSLPRPGRDARHGRVDLVLGQRAVGRLEGRAGRPGSSRRRTAGGRGRCRTGRSRRAAGRRAVRWPPRRSAAADGRATTTARSRSTAGWRGGVAPTGTAGCAAREAGDRDLGDDDALGAQVERVDDGRMELPDPASEGVAGGDPGGAAGMEVRVVGQRRRRSVPAAPSVWARSSSTPLASSRS